MCRATLSNVIAIAAGGAHSLALPRRWPGDRLGLQCLRPVRRQPTNKVVAIAAGLNHSIALRSDGVAINWGFSSDRIKGGPGDCNSSFG